MILGTLFQDGAVLQRRKAIPVWGNTVPNTTVTAVLAGKEAYCRSSATGEFLLYLPALEAGGPFELQVRAEGGKTVTVRDILIGEVWLASGQSNMSYPLGRGGSWSHGIVDPPESTGMVQQREYNATVKTPERLRYFTVAQCASSAGEKSAPGASWRYMTPENSGEASAVAAWFGEYLQESLDVPVGLIVSAWGGTVAEAWTSVEALLRNPVTFAAAMTRFDSHKLKENYSGDGKTSFDITKVPGIKTDPGISDFAANWADKELDESDWKNFEVPASWIRTGICQNGAVWVRKTVEIPAEWVGCDLELHIGGVDKHDISFVNGVEIGRTGTGLDVTCYSAERNYPVPTALVTDNKVTVAVRGFSFAYDGSFMGKWFLKRLSDGAELDITGEDWLVKVEFNWGRVNIRQVSDHMGMGNQHTPGILFDGMIRPLIPYALRGVIWYQGESNAPEHQNYYNIMKNLSQDWSYHFRDPELPFLTVQLAGYGYNARFIADDPWAFLRESQRLLAKDEKNVRMATVIDAGEVLDIHPQDKKTVGWRLAQCALGEIYGENVVPYGPEIDSAVSGGANRVILNFRYADGMKIDTAKNQAFYVSGNGVDFYPADKAEVDGSNVILTCASVKDITEVRYAWSPYPPCTLSNGAGLAAPSFKIAVGNK